MSETSRPAWVQRVLDDDRPKYDISISIYGASFDELCNVRQKIMENLKAATDVTFTVDPLSREETSVIDNPDISTVHIDRDDMPGPILVMPKSKN